MDPLDATVRPSGRSADSQGSQRSLRREPEERVTDDSEIPDVNDLLALLGNEIRMSIVRSLWEGFDFEAYVTESRGGTPHSTLFEDADTDDKGNFNYHLRRLRDVLVADQGDGYILTPLGYNLISSIDRYEGFEYHTLEERVIKTPCPYCEGELAAEYRRETLGVSCRDCDGLASGGNFTFIELSAVHNNQLGMVGLLDAATLLMFEKIRSSGHGICWDCRATMQRTVERCENHTRGPSGVCRTCDNRYEVTVDAACSNCGATGVGPLLEYAVLSPVVGAFFAKHDRDPATVGPWRYRLAAFSAATETVLGSDPLMVRFAFERNETVVQVTVEDRPTGIAIDTEPSD